MSKSLAVLGIILLVSMASCYEDSSEESEHSHDIVSYCNGHPSGTIEYTACKRSGYYAHGAASGVDYCKAQQPGTPEYAGCKRAGYYNHGAASGVDYCKAQQPGTPEYAGCKRAGYYNHGAASGVDYCKAQQPGTPEYAGCKRAGYYNHDHGYYGRPVYGRRSFVRRHHPYRWGRRWHNEA